MVASAAGGPLFPLRLHIAAWRLGTARQRKWIAAELTAIGVVIFVGQMWSNAFSIHAGAMLVGECFTGFFAVWTVHHHCDGEPMPARTQRGRWINVISYSMFFHAEHHLFPAVPTCHLAILAERLDAARGPVSKQVIGSAEILFWNSEHNPKRRRAAQSKESTLLAKG